MPLLRSAFIALSRNRLLRRFGERSSVGVKLSSRFVAGMEIEDALRVAEAVNRQGMSVSLDSLGESVTTEAEAHRAAEIYHRLLDAIARTQAECEREREADPDGPRPVVRNGRRHRREPGRSTPDRRATSSASTWKTRRLPRSRSTSCGGCMRVRVCAAPSASSSSRISIAPRRTWSSCWPMASASGYAKAPTRNRTKSHSPERRTWIPTTSA